MLGSKEEYEKFFKNDKNVNEFTEVEKDLIEMINNPRRKKRKNTEIDINDYFKLSNEKIQELNEEVKAYVPFYEGDIEKMKEDKQHLFMMSNFPDIYKITNFYLYIKKNDERKNILREKNLIADVKKITKLTDNEAKTTVEKFEMKCIWKAGEHEKNEVDEYLFEAEKNWPVECRFSEETCLEVLKKHNFNTDLCINMIKSRDDPFKESFKIK